MISRKTKLCSTRIHEERGIWEIFLGKKRGNNSTKVSEEKRNDNKRKGCHKLNTYIHVNIKKHQEIHC